MIVNYGSCIVSLQKETGLYLLVFEVTPHTDDIYLVTDGYKPIGNTIKVAKNTPVRCEAFLDGYVPYTNTIVVTDNETISATLEPGVKYTINPTPADAKVTFLIDGYEYENNELYVPINHPFTYTVSKENYDTITETVTITEPTTIDVNLRLFTPIDLSDYSFNIDDKHNVILTEYIGNESNIIAPVLNETN